MIGFKTMGDDNDAIYKIIEIWTKYGFMPMDETFCAVDSTTNEVLSIKIVIFFRYISTPTTQSTKVNISGCRLKLYPCTHSLKYGFVTCIKIHTFVKIIQAIGRNIA